MGSEPGGARVLLVPTVGACGTAVEDEEEEEEDEEELRRVSTPVLVIFNLRRLARGALSTLFKKKPSRLPLLKACRRGGTLRSRRVQGDRQRRQSEEVVGNGQ